MSRSWEGGSTSRWRRIRAAVLARDNWTCQVKTERCTGTADCVHHVLGRAVSGDDPAHLQASCTPCNLLLGDVTKGADPQPQPRTRW